MALRCACVIRGIKIPFVVEVTSSNEDASGVSVPMPAAPVAGNIFCERATVVNNRNDKTKSVNVFIVQILVGKNY